MASVRFYLKDSKSIEPSSIFMVYEIRPKAQLKFYIGQKILPRHWNKKAHRPTKGAQYRQLNILLDKITVIIKEEVLNAKIAGKILSVPDLKNTLGRRLGNPRNDNAGKPNVNSFIEQLIKERKSSPEFSDSTIKTYRTVSRIINEYQDPIEFEEISIRWRDKFVSYLYNVKGCDINYASVIIAKLSSFLNAATEDGINENLAYKKKKFRVAEIFSPKPYLNTDEIRQLVETKYEFVRHKNAVKLFALDCCIGVRYSDLAEVDFLRTSEVQGRKVYKITTSKTKTDVVIPYNPLIDQLLEDGPPRKISNVKLNLYIKEAAEIAGLDNPVEKISYPKGVLKKEKLPKYKLITVHTARRSFATNMYLAGVPVRSIMLMTGHVSETQFLKYLRISQEQNAILVAETLDQ